MNLCSEMLLPMWVLVFMGQSAASCAPAPGMEDTQAQHAKEFTGGFRSILGQPFEDLLGLPCAQPFVEWVNWRQMSAIKPRMDGGTLRLRKAREWLIRAGYYTRDEFRGVKVAWYDEKDAGGDPIDATSRDGAGLVPVPELIVLIMGQGSSSKYDLAPILAHEMIHILQIRKWGYREFACEYSIQLELGRRDRQNAVEEEAFELEDEIRNALGGSSTKRSSPEFQE